MAKLKLYSKSPPPTDPDNGFYLDQELSKVETAFTKIEDYIPTVGSAVDQQARDNIASVQNRVSTLEVTNGNANASIETERTVRANADQALAQQITTLSAQLGQNTAQIQIEQTARVTADEAMAEQVTTLEATFNENSASFDQRITAIATAQFALTQQVTLFSSQVQQSTAKLLEESTTRATEDEALSQRILTLTATVNQNTAQIQQQLTALVNQDQAQAQALTTLQAQFATNNAQVQNQFEAVSTLTSAQAKASSFLTATTGQKQSFRQSTVPVQLQSGVIWYNTAYLDQPYRWDGSKWVELTPGNYTGPAVYRQDKAPKTLVEGDLWFDTGNSNKPYRWNGSGWDETSDTRIASAEASISNEAIARANADGVLASQITTLSSSVNGLNSQVQTFASATNGLQAKWGVTIDNNGAVTGIELNSGADRKSEFKIRADKFKIEPQGGASVSPFYVENNTTYIENAVIKNGSVTKIVSTDFPGNSGLFAGSPVYLVLSGVGPGVPVLVMVNGASATWNGLTVNSDAFAVSGPDGTFPVVNTSMRVLIADGSTLAFACYRTSGFPGSVVIMALQK